MELRHMNENRLICKDFVKIVLKWLRWKISINLLTILYAEIDLYTNLAHLESCEQLPVYFMCTQDILSVMTVDDWIMYVRSYVIWRYTSKAHMLWTGDFHDEKKKNKRTQLNWTNGSSIECELFAKRVFCVRIKYFIINWNEGVESVAVVDVFRAVCFLLTLFHFPVRLLDVFSSSLHMTLIEDIASKHRWRLFIYWIGCNSIWKWEPIHRCRIHIKHRMYAMCVTTLHRQLKCQCQCEFCIYIRFSSTYCFIC